MIDLVAKSAAEGLLPVTIGALTLSEIPHREVHSIAPFKGAKVSTALKKAVGIELPEAGRSTTKGDVQVLWTARGQYFLIGAKPPKLPAAITDQSDAWCAVALTGPSAGDALARLCPLDTAKMGQGDVARSLIGHMSAIIVKRVDGFETIVFRAFARTLVHELRKVMTSLDAQAALPD
ncbi:sarcosine oxidase subunit gamma [Litoreibacter arenae]|uniref:Sarcosine oxidase gamma subunit n=1 Tax=Litoreibacter arenae DSM 19593 TaxID=1123360 RepID=S9RS65_9RHOB|nr:Sarcosine oxidase gamma subunit [Litoreibacter arenae]EPX80910.1 Sarcosine oxidase gamma subunit [Litoreibacter arenae DSM 19593]